MRHVPGEGDGARRDLAHPDSRGHGRLHHLDTVADAVLPVDVLHGTDHAGEVLLYRGDQQGPVIEDLRVYSFVTNTANVQTQLLVDIRSDGHRGRRE